MVITVVGFEHADMHHLELCFQHASLILHNPESSATIYVNKRESSGWLEYIIVYKFADGHALTVGAIQREVGGKIEFHS